MIIVGWYFIDDTLAQAIGVPGLGHVPLQVWLTLVLPATFLTILQERLKRK